RFWLFKVVLEPEMRSEGDLQVVVGAVDQVDFIASFQAQANRTDEGFKSGARVKGEVSTCTAHTSDGIAELRTIDRAAVGGLEVDEANFAGHENTERPGGTGLKLRPEQSSERPHAGVGEIRVNTRSGRISEITLKVVTRFGFEHYVGMNIETQAPADTDEVGDLRSRRKAQVIGENSDLPMIFLRRQQRRQRQAQTYPNDD